MGSLLGDAQHDQTTVAVLHQLIPKLGMPFHQGTDHQAAHAVGHNVQRLAIGTSRRGRAPGDGFGSDAYRIGRNSSR